MRQGLAIIGYGKMGKLIEQLAPEYGFEVRAKFTGGENPGGTGLSHETLRGIDVAMEFTTPVAAPVNVRRLAALGVNCVAGTTGWFEQLSEVKEAVEHAKTGLVWAANFSVGMTIFMETVARAAALFAKHAEYEAWGWEIHHSAKKDAPSGTLKKLAEQMHERRVTHGRWGLVRIARERFRARMKLVLTRRRTRSRCGTRRGAGKDLRAGRCRRRGGWRGKKDFMNSGRSWAN